MAAARERRWTACPPLALQYIKSSIDSPPWVGLLVAGDRDLLPFSFGTARPWETMLERRRLSRSLTPHTIEFRRLDGGVNRSAERADFRTDCASSDVFARRGMSYSPGRTPSEKIQSRPAGD